MEALLVTNRVRELRSASGWTQAELAERLGISRQTVISIETGRYEPSLSLAFRLAGTFPFRIEDVFSPRQEPAR